MSTLPPLAQTWLQIAEEAKEQGEWKTVQFYALKYLRHHPDHPDGRRYLGIALAMQGRISEGMEEHEKATLLAPNSALVWHDYGVTLVRLVIDNLVEDAQKSAFVDQAEEKLRKSIEVDAQYYLSYRNLLMIYLGRFGTDGPIQGGGHRKVWVERANGLLDRFFSAFGPGYPLSIDLKSLDLPDGRHFDLRQTLDVEIIQDEDDGCVVVRNDDIRAYGLGDRFWNAYLEFAHVCELLYKDFVESKEPLAESGREYADQLRTLLKV